MMPISRRSSPMKFKSLIRAATITSPPMKWFWTGAASVIAAQRNEPSSIRGEDCGIEFRQWLADRTEGVVLQLGTRRVPNTPSTVRRDWVSRGMRYICVDYQSGEDVDVVADIEKLSKTFEQGSIDAIIAASVFEHVRRPWIAAEQIGLALKPGGRAFIQTHNCFPIHAHPHDYWRFTREALESLFAREAGFINQHSWYTYPALILSRNSAASVLHPAYLNVSIVVERAT